MNDLHFPTDHSLFQNTVITGIAALALDMSLSIFRCGFSLKQPWRCGELSVPELFDLPCRSPIDRSAVSHRPGRESG